MSFKGWSSWALLALLCGFINIGDGQASVSATNSHHTVTKNSKTVGAHKMVKPSVSVNPNTVIAAYNQAVFAYKLKHDAEAETTLRKALALSKNAKGLPLKITGSIKHLLGFTLYREGKTQEATSYLKQSLTIMSRPEIAVANQSVVMDELLLLGQSAMMNGNYAEAEHYCTAASPLAEKILGSDNPRTKQNAGFIADIHKMDMGSDDYLSSITYPTVVHWRDAVRHPIIVCIEDGNEIPGWKAADKEVVRAAYQEWETVLDGLVRFEFTDNPEQADTIVSWMLKPAPLEETIPGGTMELASGACRSKQNKHYLIDDNIVLAVNDLHEKPFTDTVLRNTSLHEIEHSLGAMHGHSSVPTDILFFSSKYDNGRHKPLSARDIQTLKALYALNPDITNPPGIHLVRFSHYITELKIASDTYNQQNYSLAYVHYTKALSLYNQDPETRFFMGMSTWKLQRFDEAIPYFLSVTYGNRQPEALMMAGNSLIQAGENNEREGNQQLAFQKYHQAQDVLTQCLQFLSNSNSLNGSLNAKYSEECQNHLQWLNQRFTAQSNPLIQWSNAANPSPPPTTSSAQKPWFQFW